MNKIQIKIDRNISTFNNEAEVISFMGRRLAKKKNSRSYKSDLIQAAKRVRCNRGCGATMTNTQTKTYLLNAQD